MPRRGQIGAHVLAGADQIACRLLLHAGHRDAHDLAQVQQPGQMPGIPHIGLDPIPGRRCSFDGAATWHEMPCPVRNRANPNPVGPAS